MLTGDVLLLLHGRCRQGSVDKGHQGEKRKHFSHVSTLMRTWPDPLLPPGRAWILRGGSIQKYWGSIVLWYANFVWKRLVFTWPCIGEQLFLCVDLWRLWRPAHCQPGEKMWGQERFPDAMFSPMYSSWGHAESWLRWTPVLRYIHTSVISTL